MTDGTPAGTTILVDANPGPTGSDPTDISAFGSQIFFSATDATRGRELWITDGTQAGTRVVDVAPGPLSSEPGNFVQLGSLVLFRANTSPYGNELWRTDGTPTGTALVADVRTGAASSFPVLYGTLNNGVVFSANDGVHGREMWLSDGTPAGSRLLADLAPGPDSSDFGSTDRVQKVGTTLFYCTYDTLYATDGTSPGTRTIRSFPSPLSIAVWLVGPLSTGQLLFSAYDSVAGVEPWVTDGVSTSVLLNVNPEPAGATNGSFAGLPSVSPLLALNDGINGNELWYTDGTSPGTALLRDIRAGADSSNPIHTGVFLGDRALVSADDGVNGRELWITGGANGAQLLKDIQPGPGNGSSGFYSTTPFRDRVVFAADNGTQGQEPWVTDGTSAGTFLLRDIAPFASGSVGVQRMGAQVFIFSYLINSTNLWRTDGTTTGTTQVPLPVTPAGRFVSLRGRLYFAGTTAGAGTELWSTDGTAAGTSMVADIVPGTGSSYPFLQAAWDDRLWFAASTPATGSELWASDGTASGTRLVMDANPGPADSAPDGWRVAGSMAFFATFSPVTGDEVYVITPGNAPTLLKDIWPGAQNSDWYPGFASSRYLWFTAADPIAGSELWRTDGTTSGTVRVTDLWPGPASSGAYVLGPVGSALLLWGDNGTTGPELWTLNPGAMTYTRGHPCGQGIHEPTLAVDDPVLGAPMGIKVSDVASSSPGVLLFGFPGPAAPLGNGCSLYLSSPSVFTLFTTDATGSWSMGLTLPNIPALTGVLTAMQAAVAATPTIAGLESTAASILAFGQ